MKIKTKKLSIAFIAFEIVVILLESALSQHMVGRESFENIEQWMGK